MTTIKSYNDALNFIFSLRKPRENYTPGIHLERLKIFLNEVGNPQDDYKIIHVGGTSGKGSVTYLTAKILIEHGLKTGSHTSPHLLSINEKFQINHNNISNAKLIELTQWLKSSLVNFESKFNLQLSYYEGIIAMVFKYFSINQVDVAVIEVGLGGKLDATNVVNSQIAVLTNIGLDHMEILGNTKEEILKDKVEIMKQNAIFITGVTEPYLQMIIKKNALKRNNTLYIYEKDFYPLSPEISKNSNKFDFKTQSEIITDINLTLAGEFQIQNACLAIQAAKLFLAQKFNPDAIKSALSTSQFMGRFQTIQKSPPIMLDGAHNESKMRALAKSINPLYKGKQLIALISFKKGKDLNLIIEEFIKLNLKTVIITEFVWEYYDKLESYPAESIKIQLEKYRKDINIIIVKDPIMAFQLAKKTQNREELLLVTGSLYLIGTLLQEIKL